LKFPSWLFPCAFATRRYALPLLCASVPSAAFAPRRHAKPLLRGAMLCDAFAAHYRAAHSLCCAEPDDAFAMFSFALPRVTFASRNSTVPGATELCLCGAAPRCATPLLCASTPGFAFAGLDITLLDHAVALRLNAGHSHCFAMPCCTMPLPLPCKTTPCEALLCLCYA